MASGSTKLDHTYNQRNVHIEPKLESYLLPKYPPSQINILMEVNTNTGVENVRD